jgi:hypothetical protein
MVSAASRLSSATNIRFGTAGFGPSLACIYHPSGCLSSKHTRSEIAQPTIIQT